MVHFIRSMLIFYSLLLCLENETRKNFEDRQERKLERANNTGLQVVDAKVKEQHDGLSRLADGL